MADQAANTDQKTDAKAAEQSNDSKKQTFQLKVYAPFKVYFEGPVYSLTGVNETGPFDILAHHHNFLCMLIPCNLIIKTAEGDSKIIKISRALLHVKSEKAVIFLDV